MKKLLCCLLMLVASILVVGGFLLITKLSEPVLTYPTLPLSTTARSMEGEGMGVYGKYIPILIVEHGFYSRKEVDEHIKFLQEARDRMFPYEEQKSK